MCASSGWGPQRKVRVFGLGAAAQGARLRVGGRSARYRASRLSGTAFEQVLAIEARGAEQWHGGGLTGRITRWHLSLK
jgi:hypothetical protein